MDRKSYKAFTLIEMLIVMGILVILMVVGIAAGRFATQRAQDIAHQNAAAQIYQALQSYYTDYGKYPEANTLETLIGSPTSPGSVGKYMDLGAFDGGNDATFWYFVNGSTHQTVVVCVSLGGYGDDSARGIYCDGNGFGDKDLAIADGTTGESMPKGKLESKDDHSTYTYYNAVKTGGAYKSNWNGGANAWEGGSGGEGQP